MVCSQKPEQLIWQPAAIAKVQVSLAQSLYQFLSLQCLQDTLAKGKCMPKHSASAMSAYNRWKKGPCATEMHHARRSQHWHLSQHYKGWLRLICKGSFSETTGFFPQTSLHNNSRYPEPNLNQCQQGSCKTSPESFRSRDPTCTFCRQCPYCGMLVSVQDCLPGRLWGGIGKATPFHVADSQTWTLL